MSDPTPLVGPSAALVALVVATAREVATQADLLNTLDGLAGDGDLGVTAGHAAYGTRNYREAAACWKAEVEARPERAYGHYMLGLSLWKSGRLEPAEAALRRAAELNPASLRTFLNLSRVLNERGEFEAALEAA